jgi:hypothetical protein
MSLYLVRLFMKFLYLYHEASDRWFLFCLQAEPALRVGDLGSHSGHEAKVGAKLTGISWKIINTFLTKWSKMGIA